MFGMVGCGLAVIALVVMISASAFADTGKTKIRMGYIADYLGTSVAAIATKLNLWEKHGLDAELKRFTNGPIQVQALGADSLGFRLHRSRSALAAGLGQGQGRRHQCSWNG